MAVTPVKLAVALGQAAPEPGSVTEQQWQMWIDDASSSRTYKSGKGRVTILDEWWVILGLIESQGAFSVDMVGGFVVHLPWCTLMLGGNYCSCGVDIAGTPIYEVT